MKILVVDDEQSFGSLLGRTLKRLGHRTVIAVHPSDALELMKTETVDAVITDIDMPVMSGVQLAEAIRAAYGDMPIAFCTGSSRDQEVVSAASRYGRVLPKVWTVADVKDVVDSLRKPARSRLARGSEPDMTPNRGVLLATGTAAPAPTRAASPGLTRAPSPDPAAVVPVATDNTTRKRRAQTNREQPEAYAPRSGIRKVRMACRSWRQVVQLCEDQAAGRTSVTVRGSAGMEVGDRVIVALSLPDELVLSLNAVVTAVGRDSSGRDAYSVRLLGLTDELCARLRAMAQPHLS